MIDASDYDIARHCDDRRRGPFLPAASQNYLFQATGFLAEITVIETILLQIS